MASRADMVELCIAVLDSLGGEQSPEYVIPFTAERNYMPRPDLSDGGSLKVFGMPVSSAAEIRTRKKTTVEDIGIQLGVMVKVQVNNGQVDTQEMDDLLLLMEQIKDHVTDATDTLFDGSVALQEIVHDLIFDPEILNNNHEFRSTPIFIFRCSRNRNP